MSRDVLSKRAEKALRGLFRESFRRMDDEELLALAAWCEWLQGQIRDKHPGGLDTLTDEQMNEYLAQVEAKFLVPAGGEV